MNEPTRVLIGTQSAGSATSLVTVIQLLRQNPRFEVKLVATPASHDRV